MNTQPKKSKTLLTRTDLNEYRTITKAAELSGMRPATFIRFAALKLSKSIIKPTASTASKTATK